MSTTNTRTTGPYAVIVAAHRADAEHWARQHYNQADPHAIEIGYARDGVNKTFHVYDQAITS